MDTETRSSLNSKSFLYTIKPMHLSDEPEKNFSRHCYASVCRSSPSVSKRAASASKSNAFTKRKKKNLISNFSISNFTKNVKFS